MMRDRGGLGAVYAPFDLHMVPIIITTVPSDRSWSQQQLKEEMDEETE